MQAITGSQQLERILALEGDIWGHDRYLMEDPAQLQELADLFPGQIHYIDASHPIDLDLLNSFIRPRKFLATWEPEGLLFFRLRL